MQSVERMYLRNKKIMIKKDTIILSIVNCVFGGGAEKNVLEVGEHLGARYDIVFLLSGKYIDPKFYEIGRVYILPFGGRKLLLPVHLLYMGYLVVQHKARLIHAHHRYPSFLATSLAKILQVKVVSTVHNRFPDKAKLSVWGDIAIAVSYSVGKWLLEICRLDPMKLRVVHNGIEEIRLCENEEIKIMKEKLGISNNTNILCTVGRLTKQKNYRCLIEALSLVKNPNWVLLLIGDGEEKDALRKQAVELGLEKKIYFLGHRLDVQRIMQASDIFVLSSLWEGLPYVVLEALCCGLPIISTDVGGVSEAVIDKETGILVPPGIPEMLAIGIDKLIDDDMLKETYSKKGKELFNHRFKKRTMLKKVDLIYKELIG